MKTFPVAEIFGPTIQGEGLHIGRRTWFIRFAGCDTKCAWCDTKYAWDVRNAMILTEDDILERVGKIITPIVTLTGGNPAIYELSSLCERLLLCFYEVHVETQGTIWKNWLARTSFISVSPKRENLRTEVLDKIFSVCGDRAQMKVVIFGHLDILFAKGLGLRYPHIPLILQMGFPADYDSAALINEVIHDTELGQSVRLLPQLHRIFWGNKKGV